jgi:hypothetical protein
VASARGGSFCGASHPPAGSSVSWWCGLAPGAALWGCGGHRPCRAVCGAVSPSCDCGGRRVDLATAGRAALVAVLAADGVFQPGVSSERGAAAG